MTAEIILFPPQARACFDCKNAYVSTSGNIYCALFSEFIYDEAEANDCEGYES